MKRIFCLVLTLLLALLCACGQTDTTPIDDPTPANPVTSLDDVPQVCRLYYTYADWSPIAPTNSKLPLAASASRGAPNYLSLWHQGEYTQLGGEGLSIADVTGGKATEEGAYGRFCWNDELYHCVHIKADSCLVPSVGSVTGGILWLELSGDCWADTGFDEAQHFEGFDTVVITGSGTLTLTQSLSGGTGQTSLPALIIDGVDVACPAAELTANTDPENTANLIVCSGSLTTDLLTVSGDACVTGGSVSVGLMLDCARLVCRGGLFTLTDGWGFSQADLVTSPTVLLTGGTLDANVWMDETIEYQLWAGTITAPGVRNWPGTHLLGDNVTIIDPLDESQSG